MALGNPDILLLGGGFTLERAALALPPDRFVITSRSSAKCDMWKARGWNAAEVHYESDTKIRELFAAYPSLRIIVDGVPPLSSGDPTRGVRRVCDALAGTGVSRIVYLSTTGVFGVHDGAWVDESTPARPNNPKAEARLRCEEVYRCTGLPCSILRLPAIYGHGRGIVESLRQGRYRLIGDGIKWTNRIHVDDLVLTICTVLGLADVPDVVCVSDNEPARAKDVVEFVCSMCGFPSPLSITEEEAREQGAYTMLSNQRVSNSRLRTVLADKLKYPSFREGLLAEFSA